MSRKLWKANIIIALVAFIALLAVGTTLLVISSQRTPSAQWINIETGELYSTVAFDGSTMYLVGAVVTSISFLFFGFLFINYWIRKAMIKDIKKEKANGGVKMNLDKYGFLLAHVIPYTKKQKDILEGIL